MFFLKLFFWKNLYFSSHLIYPSLDLREGHVVPWIMSLPLQGTPQDSKVLGKRSEYPKHIIVSSERLFPGDFPLGDPLFMISGGGPQNRRFRHMCPTKEKSCSTFHVIYKKFRLRRWKKSDFWGIQQRTMKNPYIRRNFETYFVSVGDLKMCPTKAPIWAPPPEIIKSGSPNLKCR